MSQMKEYYQKEVVPALLETFKYGNIMQVPKLEKIVLNIGMGEAIQNIKVLDSAVEELTAVAGQKPVITRAKNRLLLSS
jgi:large subunit ribosomal protein L5